MIAEDFFPFERCPVPCFSDYLMFSFLTIHTATTIKVAAFIAISTITNAAAITSLLKQERLLLLSHNHHHHHFHLLLLQQ